MGIPSYFAHIVRRRRRIIKEFVPGTGIDNLYLDCNSLIYDAARSMSKAPGKNFETGLIAAVCARIEGYFRRLKPRERAYIAFDGMAPVAKLEQQRNRRYKGWFQNSIIERTDPTYEKPVWDTVAITPGTAFMRNLGARVTAYFKSAGKFGLKTIVVSTSAEAGEGEHKIYKYIRDNAEHHGQTRTVIYGLDADLIMLTLNHLHVAPDMHLFRETPDFIRSLDRSLNPNASYMLDIPAFGRALTSELGGGENRVSDYILLCFFLGNDFLPHFPSLNIRTEGIDRLLVAYRSVCGPTNGLTRDGNVVWPNVRRLVSYLAEREHTHILAEYARREKQSRNVGRYEKTVEDKLMAVPMRDRTDEIYIDPDEPGWETRYYRRLFGIEITDGLRKEISTNFLEGLEWTFRYYSTGCPDWRWCYEYDYPPLLGDLVNYVPRLDAAMLEPSGREPVTDLVQLSYVLPKSALHLLPGDLRARLFAEHSDWYEAPPRFKWAYCRYFWEAHACLPRVELDSIERLVAETGR